MLIRWLAVCCVCLCLVACGGGFKPRSTDANAGIVPERIENEGTRLGAEMKVKVGDLLAKKDFDGLDALADELRKSQAESACGRWKLDYFYWAFSHDGIKRDSEWTKRIDAVKEWVDKKPESVTARVALANLKWRYAWVARGGGWAEDVNDEGWRKMREREAEALKILQEVQPDCPRWYFVRLELAKDMKYERKEYDTIFEQAVARYPTYKHAYFLKAKCLQPRWHGEEGEWEKFAEESADKRGGDEGDVLYTQIVWDVDSTGWYAKGNIFKDFRLLWPRIQKGFAVMMKNHPESKWLESEYCKLACLAGDRSAARAMFDKINPSFDSVVWKRQENFVEHRDWAYSGPTTTAPSSSGEPVTAPSK